MIVCAFTYRGLALLLPGSALAALPLPIVRVSEFALGMALAWAIRSGWRLRIPPAVGIAAMIGVVFAIVFVSHTGLTVPLISLIPPAFGNELFTLACAVAIVALAQKTLAGKRSWFESRLQVKLGEWSFAFYLVHATVIYLALRIFGPQGPAWHNVLWFAAILAVDITLAWALHSFVERPLEKRMRRWKDRRTAARLDSAAV